MEEGLGVTHRLSLIAAVLLLVAPNCVGAQQETSGAGRASASGAVQALSGSVVDPSGASIPNAQVTVRKGTNAVAETKTDAVGAFRLANLVPGSYQVAVHADGFVDADLQTSVGDRKSNAIRIVLRIAVQTETVTVAGTHVPLVSTATAENQNANTIDRNALDRVPVFDQDYIAAMSRFLDDNAIGTNGVTLVVNGIEANGPGVTPSAVQEVRINNNPYSARFSRPGRARLEIITKGGTPNFHGSLNFMFRDSVFDASNAFALAKPPERRQYYEGSVTGPLAHSKRTSFLLALDDDLLDQQAIVDPGALSAAEALGFGPSLRAFPIPLTTSSGRVVFFTISPMATSSGSATPTSIARLKIRELEGQSFPARLPTRVFSNMKSMSVISTRSRRTGCTRPGFWSATTIAS